jgi:TPR repeat protein
MAHLGHVHAGGVGVPQDNATALSWFLKAADHGHASGFLGLGYMHLTGTGAPRDHAKALRYFQGASQAAGVGAWPGGGDAYFFLGAPPARVCVCLGSLWECVSFLGGHVGCVCDETC